MRKFLLSGCIILIVAITWGLYLLLSGATNFEKEKQYVYVKPGIDAKNEIRLQVDTASLIKRSGVWFWMMDISNSWNRVTAGRFEIKKGMNLYELVMLFRRNQQSAVKLIINKLRTPEDLSKLVAKNFMIDSAAMYRFLINTDTLASFSCSTDTWMTAIIPNTYELNWTASPNIIYSRLVSEQKKFWSKNNRFEKASAIGFTTEQVYTIASIVEEETNKNDEKGNVASVYINRVNRNMPLGADPTIKFALKDFSLKRILYKHLEVESPFNTYKHVGLPPGPICTPQIVTIDAVLDAQKTDYIFFVAKSDFSGYHHFSVTFAEHNQYAKEYQDSLNAFLLRKKQQKQ